MKNFFKKYIWVIAGVLIAAAILLFAFMSGGNVEEAKKATLSTYLYRSKCDMNNIYSHVRRMRIMGAIAVEMCFVAEGIYDVFLDTQAVRVLDIAASQLIIKEAGGYITDINSNVLSSQIDLLEKTTIVATTNQKLQEEIIRLLE